MQKQKSNHKGCFFVLVRVTGLCLGATFEKGEWISPAETIIHSSSAERLHYSFFIRKVAGRNEG